MSYIGFKNGVDLNLALLTLKYLTLFYSKQEQYHVIRDSNCLVPSLLKHKIHPIPHIDSELSLAYLTNLLAPAIQKVRMASSASECDKTVGEENIAQVKSQETKLTKRDEAIAHIKAWKCTSVEQFRDQEMILSSIEYPLRKEGEDDDYWCSRIANMKPLPDGSFDAWERYSVVYQKDMPEFAREIKDIKKKVFFRNFEYTAKQRRLFKLCGIETSLLPWQCCGTDAHVKRPREDDGIDNEEAPHAKTQIQEVEETDEDDAMCLDE